MKDKINNTIEQISDEIKKIKEFDDSILNSLGIFLFIIEYNKYRGTPFDSQIDKFTKAVDNYNKKANQKSQTFSEGYLSYGILFHHLVRNGYLVKNELFEFNIQRIAILSGKNQLMLNNFDFFYGATGIINYLIVNNKENKEQVIFFQEYLDHLKLCKLNINGGIAWEDYYCQIREAKASVNLGLAHGIPAILKILVLLYKNNLGNNREDTLIQIKNVVTFLINSKNKKEIKISNYSNSLYVINSIEDTSRLAWCYGDLSIGFILFQVGKIINDNVITEYGKNLVYITTSRKSFDETMICDAGICHGSAGVSHIYNRMWLYTSEKIFKEAADYWLLKTLNFAMHTDGLAGYKKYDPIKKNRTNDNGFLEGIAGIGLVLLTYISGDFAWDYCLMLND